MSKVIVLDKSKAFADRIIKMHKYLTTEMREFEMSKQILKSGTSIGANVSEAQQAQSKVDFISKLSIALKEAKETEYWIERLYKGKYLTEKQYNSINTDCIELIKLLTSIIKSTKSK